MRCEFRVAQHLTRPFLTSFSDFGHYPSKIDLSRKTPISSVFEWQALMIFSTLMWAIERGTWDMDKGCYTRELDGGKCSPYQSDRAKRIYFQGGR